MALAINIYLYYSNVWLLCLICFKNLKTFENFEFSRSKYKYLEVENLQIVFVLRSFIKRAPAQDISIEHKQCFT